MRKQGTPGTTEADRQVGAGSTAGSAQAFDLTGLIRSRALHRARSGQIAVPPDGRRHGRPDLAIVRPDHAYLSWRGTEALRALRAHRGSLGQRETGP